VLHKDPRGRWKYSIENVSEEGRYIYFISVPQSFFHQIRSLKDESGVYKVAMELFQTGLGIDLSPKVTAI
jgi:hypothetical protein